MSDTPITDWPAHFRAAATTALSEQEAIALILSWHGLTPLAIPKKDLASARAAFDSTTYYATTFPMSRHACVRADLY